MWDFFLEMISTFTSGALFLTNLGNHESDSPKSASFYDGTDSGACISNFTSKFLSTAFEYCLFDKMSFIWPGGECGVISIALMPQPYPSTVNKPWWSYDIGTIHMMGMSTEHDFRVGSDQYKW